MSENATSLAGFAALELLSPHGCRPLDQQRDGLVLGEAVAAVWLSCVPGTGRRADWRLAGLAATLYWGEPGAFEHLGTYGLAGLAGDLNADGALGSRTAALREPYADRAGHRGHAYLTAEQIAEHVIACTERNVQAGFHCIGDQALDNIARGFELAAEKVGVQALVAARHRLEHVEMVDEATIATLARCGVVASVQPMFDGLWGGPDGMYAERVGDRWRGMNPFGSLARAGVVLAFGSDAPVTELGGWEAVRAAAFHHEPSER